MTLGKQNNDARHENKNSAHDILEKMAEKIADGWFQQNVREAMELGKRSVLFRHLIAVEAHFTITPAVRCNF